MKFSSSSLRAGAILLLIIGSSGSALAQASALYGVTFFSNELIKVDPITGAGTLVATLSEPVSPYGLGFRGSQLYTFDSGSDRIREINRFNGTVSGSFDIGVGDLLGEGDLTFRSDGIGFLTSALTPDFEISNDLFRFDLTTGTSVRVGMTDVVLDGLVFSGSTLYAIGQEAEAKLYVVNQNNAALTEIGLLGVENNSLFGALTVGANGTLYGAINDRLYSIDKLTGQASELSADVLDIGYASVSGAAFSPVPEPSTYGLAGVAGLMLIGFVRRKRAAGKSARPAV